MDTKNSSPSITDSALRMPVGFPEVPNEVIERFPQMRNWMDEVNNFWRKNVNAVDDFARSVLDVTHVAGILTVDPNTGSMYVKTTRGPGAFADPDTPFYIDSQGRFSLSNKVTWNGSVFTIVGGGGPIDWDTDIVNIPGELNDGRIPAAINAAGLVVSGVAPGIVVSPGGVAGLYLGSDFLGYYNGSTWRTYMDNTGNFYLGGTSGNLQWNGTTLTITGSITLTNTISYTSVTGLGALATQSSVAYGDITGTKPPANADVTLSAIQGSLSLAGGGLVLASGGASIRGGQTAYDTGNGFWLGDVSGTTKFSLGSSSGKMTWDGSALVAGGFTLASDNLSAGSGATRVQLDTNGDIGLLIGTTSPGPYIQICRLSTYHRLQIANSSGTIVASVSDSAAGGSLYVSDGVLVGNGNSGTPSMRFATDLDTGFYLQGTNAIGIAIGAQAAGFFSAYRYTWTNSTVSGIVGVDTSNSKFEIGTTTNHGLRFYTNNSLRGEITNGGLFDWDGNMDLAGTLSISGTQVVTSRQSGVSDGPTDASGGMGTSDDFSGGDTVDKASLTSVVNTHGAKLNSFATKINSIGTAVNTVIDRLQTHGLIS